MGGNERGNWAQLGEVVGGREREGGEAAERSHNVFGPNEDPSGDASTREASWEPRDRRTRRRITGTVMRLIDKLTLTVQPSETKGSLKVSIYL